MAKQAGPVFLERTIDDVIFYKMDGKYYVRLKPVFPDIRTSPRFAGTMRYARWMARASKIGSVLYAMLPPGLKQFSKYRGAVGEAMYLLKAGMADEEATLVLQRHYRSWIDSSLAIAGAVYSALGTGFKEEWMYWAFAEEAMEMMKEGKAEEDVQQLIRVRYANNFKEDHKGKDSFKHSSPVAKRPPGRRINKYPPVLQDHSIAAGPGPELKRPIFCVQQFPRSSQCVYLFVEMQERLT